MKFKNIKIVNLLLIYLLIDYVNCYNCPKDICKSYKENTDCWYKNIYKYVFCTLSLNDRNPISLNCINFVNNKHNISYFSNDTDYTFISKNFTCKNGYVPNLKNDIYLPIYDMSYCLYKNKEKLKS